MKVIEIDTTILQPYPAVVLPQDWPGVCSYYYPQSVSVTGFPDWDNMEQVQISLRGNFYPEGEKQNRGIIVEKIVLEY